MNKNHKRRLENGTTATVGINQLNHNDNVSCEIYIKQNIVTLPPAKNQQSLQISKMTTSNKIECIHPTDRQTTQSSQDYRMNVNGTSTYNLNKIKNIDMIMKIIKHIRFNHIQSE